METIRKFLISRETNIISCEGLNFSTEIELPDYLLGNLHITYANNKVYIGRYRELYCYDINGNLIKTINLIASISRMESISTFIVLFHCSEDIVGVFDEDLNLVFGVQIILNKVVKFNDKIVCLHYGQILELTLTDVGAIVLSPLNDPRFTIEKGKKYLTFLKKLIFCFEDKNYVAKMGDEYLSVYYLEDDCIYTQLDGNIVKKSLIDLEKVEIIFNSGESINFPVFSLPETGPAFCD
jgi:hypothetical protein